MIALAADSIDAWFLADIPGIGRAASASDLADSLRAAGVAMISTSRNPRQALRRAQSMMAPGDRLVVFGSFHTVAGVIPSLEKDLDRDIQDDLDKAEA